MFNIMSQKLKHLKHITELGLDSIWPNILNPVSQNIVYRQYSLVSNFTIDIVEY